MTARGMTLLAAGTLCLAACGDDESIDNADAPPPGIDAARADAEPPMVDADTFTPPTPIAVPLSATGPDQLFGATPAPGGGFYVAGFAADGVAATDPRLVTVARLTAAGALDTTFGGGDGIATTTFDFRGGSDEVDLALQSDGKILVSATIASNTNPADRDVAVIRLDTAGALDPTFAIDGLRRLDLSTALDPGTGILQGMDGARAIGVDAMDRIYIHAVQRGEEPAGRTDTDFALIRLDADGDPDNSYADNSKFLLDLTGGGPPTVSLSATPRAIHVFADGSVIASGYTTNSAFSVGPQPVLYRLEPDGDPDPGFAAGGVFFDVVLAMQTEVYGFAVHGGNLVTGGYGRDTGDQNDWISLRFDTATGARDLTWGGTTNGAVVHDVSGAMIGDNCRNAVGLPDGKTVLVGSTGPSNDPAQDAVFAVLSATGTLDPAYGDGIHGFDVGGNDAFWVGALSGSNAILAGYRGAGTMQTTAANDDAYVVILPVR